MDAVVFDLGGTLVDFTGPAPRWEQHYRDALSALAVSLGVTPHPGQLGRAASVLRGHNPRLHPRVDEVPFARILEELLPCFGVAGPVDALACARTFFQVYRQPLQCFDDTGPALEGLRTREKKIGVFAESAYGMPTELIREDAQLAGLDGLYDAFRTSVDTGYRKPSGESLYEFASLFGCRPSAILYVGNEQADVETAKAAGCKAVVIDRADQRPAWGQDRVIGSLMELWVEHGWF